MNAQAFAKTPQSNQRKIDFSTSAPTTSVEVWSTRVNQFNVLLLRSSPSSVRESTPKRPLAKPSVNQRAPSASLRLADQVSSNKSFSKSHAGSQLSDLWTTRRQRDVCGSCCDQQETARTELYITYLT